MTCVLVADVSEATWCWVGCGPGWSNSWWCVLMVLPHTINNHIFLFNNFYYFFYINKYVHLWVCSLKKRHKINKWTNVIFEFTWCNIGIQRNYSILRAFILEKKGIITSKLKSKTPKMQFIITILVFIYLCFFYKFILPLCKKTGATILYLLSSCFTMVTFTPIAANWPQILPENFQENGTSRHKAYELQRVLVTLTVKCFCFFGVWNRKWVSQTGVARIHWVYILLGHNSKPQNCNSQIKPFRVHSFWPSSHLRGVRNLTSLVIILLAHFSKKLWQDCYGIGLSLCRC